MAHVKIQKKHLWKLKEDDEVQNCTNLIFLVDVQKEGKNSMKFQ